VIHKSIAVHLQLAVAYCASKISPQEYEQESTFCKPVLFLSSTLKNESPGGKGGKRKRKKLAATMGHSKSLSVAPLDDDFEFDESYFRQFYKPLSNLPTPPPSTRNSSAAQSPRLSVDDVEGLNSQFLGWFNFP